MFCASFGISLPVSRFCVTKKKSRDAMPVKTKTQTPSGVIGRYTQARGFGFLLSRVVNTEG